MKVKLDQQARILILTSEDARDIYRLGRLAEATKTKGQQNNGSYELEVGIDEILNALLK